MSGPVVISIEPRLPPQFCGTSTFGWALSRHWPEPRPYFVHLVVDGAEASRKLLETHDIFEVGESGARLSKQMEGYPGANVILHYSSRGFQRYGCPLWLARALAHWRRRHARSRLLIFFHEVPHPLPLTSRHYLFTEINRRIIRKMAGLADVIVTNTEEHAQRLEAICGVRHVPFLPVPSNIPAPKEFDGHFFHRDAGRFVIFGLPFTHLLTIQHFAAELAAWHAAGILKQLHLIGPADEKFSPLADDLLRRILPEEAVIRHGALDPAGVSAVLARTGFCLTQSHAGNFSKSGTFSAFAAHGCPVVARMKSSLAQAPMCFVTAPEELTEPPSTADLAEFARRGQALREWYLREADWPVLAANIARFHEGSGR